MAEPVEHLPGAEEASGWIGARVDDMRGTPVGRIESLLVDARAETPTWFVIKRGRFGRRSAIPAPFAAAGVGHVWVPFDRETIRSAPDVDPDGGLSREDERRLASHFGIPEESLHRGVGAVPTDADPGSAPSV
jgi:hypothetical protein